MLRLLTNPRCRDRSGVLKGEKSDPRRSFSRTGETPRRGAQDEKLSKVDCWQGPDYHDDTASFDECRQALQAPLDSRSYRISNETLTIADCVRVSIELFSSNSH